MKVISTISLAALLFLPLMVSATVQNFVDSSGKIIHYVDGDLFADKVEAGRVDTSSVDVSQNVSLPDGSLALSKIIVNGQAGEALTIENSKAVFKALPPPGSLTDTVISSSILNQEITTIKIDNGAVTENKIQDAAVTGEKIQDDTISSEKIVDGSIESRHIENSAAVTSQTIDSLPNTGTLQLNSSMTIREAVSTLNAAITSLASNLATRLLKSADANLTQNLDFTGANATATNLTVDGDLTATSINATVNDANLANNLSLTVAAGAAPNSIVFNGSSGTELVQPTTLIDSNQVIAIDPNTNSLAWRHFRFEKLRITSPDPNQTCDTLCDQQFGVCVSARRNDANFNSFEGPLECTARPAVSCSCIVLRIVD